MKAGVALKVNQMKYVSLEFLQADPVAMGFQVTTSQEHLPFKP